MSASLSLLSWRSGSRRWIILVATVAVEVMGHGVNSESATGGDGMRAPSTTDVGVPAVFTPNLGQFPPGVLFHSRTGISNVWITTDGVVYQFARLVGGEDRGIPESSHIASGAPSSDEPQAQALETFVLATRFTGASPAAAVTTGPLAAQQCNYFLGNDPNRWRAGVSTYSSVLVKDIYTGIDLRYQTVPGGLEYDFIVHPGADPDAIGIELQGCESVAQAGDGSLLLETQWGRLKKTIPSVYQEVSGVRVPVMGSFVIRPSKTIGFKLGVVPNPQEPVVIDPVISYSSFLGGSGYEIAKSVEIGSDGAAYVCGTTASLDFPVDDPFQDQYAGGGYYPGDVFISHLAQDGSGLIYSTYLGGSDYDEGWGIDLGPDGSIYVTGLTNSTDYPLLNPLQSAKAAGADVIISRLTPQGDALLFSSYLGGGNYDGATDVAVDGEGRAYLTGETKSTDFPTVNAYVINHSGGVSDAFVACLNADGASLAFSTYLGGSSYELGRAISVTASGVCAITGTTGSLDFPIEAALQPTHGGNGTYYLGDAFVAKFDPAGVPAFITFLGGVEYDEGWGVDMDPAGNVYVAGLTYSVNFPVANPVQSMKSAAVDAFTSVFSSDGSSLSFSTYLGGSNYDGATDVAIGDDGQLRLTGETKSPDFPVINPAQAIHGGGGSDAFLTVLNPGAPSVTMSTFFGGAGHELVWRLDTDPTGAAVLVGQTAALIVGGCNCDCHTDPVCDHFTTALDVAVAIDVVFFGSPPIPDPDPSCPVEVLDVDCDGNVSAVDLALLIDVTYFSAPAATTFCNPCLFSDFPTVLPFQGSFGGGSLDAFVARVAP